MPSVSTSKHVPASPEKVWETLLDLPRWEDWLTLHVSWKGDLPETVSQGSQITEVVSVMGMANKIDWTVSDFAELKQVKIQGTGMAAVKISIDFAIEPDGEGSKVTIEADFAGAMIVGPIGSAVAKAAQKDLDESMTKFAELVA